MATARKPKPTPRPVLPDSLPLIPYRRVSDVDGRGGESYGTLKEQTRSIDTTAARFDLPLMEEPFPGAFTDEDRTGGDFDRPGWQLAMKLIREGKARGIVAKNQARMSRARQGETLAMVAEVEELGGKLYDDTGQVSVDGGMQELMTGIKAWQNAAEREQRRADRMTSVKDSIARGAHLSAPFGYRKGLNEKGDRKGTPLEILVDEHGLTPEADQVRQMWALRAEGLTWPAIARACNESGARPRPYKRDGEMLQAQWTHKTVRQIVLNDVYLGVAYNGDHRTEKAHPAIITDLKLAKRARKAKGTKPIGPEQGYLLTGLVRCSGCGYAMTHNPDGGRRYYRCRAAQHGDGRCPNPVTVPAEPLEEWAAAEFRRRHLGQDRFQADDTDERVAAAEADVEMWEARASGSMRVLAYLGDGVSGRERRLAETQLEEDRAGLRQAESALRAAQMEADGVDLPLWLDWEVFSTAPVDRQRHFLALAFSCVAVRRAAHWREPAADRAQIVPRTGAPSNGAALRAFVTDLDW